MSPREAFEQTEHCLDETIGADGLYADKLTAIHWLVFLVAWQTTIWHREAV